MSRQQKGLLFQLAFQKEITEQIMSNLKDEIKKNLIPKIGIFYLTFSKKYDQLFNHSKTEADYAHNEFWINILKTYLKAMTTLSSKIFEFTN